MEFEIPVFDAEVDTSDVGGTAMNLVGAVAGGVGLLGVAATAQYVYNRVQNVAGSDDSADIPGI